MTEDERHGVGKEEADEDDQLLAFEATGEEGNVEEREGDGGPKGDEPEGGGDGIETPAQRLSIEEFARTGQSIGRESGRRVRHRGHLVSPLDPDAHIPRRALASFRGISSDAGGPLAADVSGFLSV